MTRNQFCPLEEAWHSDQTLGSGIGSGEFKPKLVTYWLCQFGQITYSSFYLLLFLLEYNCFTVSCQFLLYSKVNQPYTHTPTILSFLVSSLVNVVTQMVKNLPAMQEIQVGCLGWEDPLEKEMATQFRILPQRIPWTEESGVLQSMKQQSRTQLSN